MTDGTLGAILFWLAALGAVGFALGVVAAKSPLQGALSLIGSLCSVALLYIVLHASFVAAMQILVYAGAIMVLFVFVIMLLNLGPTSMRSTVLSVGKGLGVLAGLYLFVRLVGGAAASGGTSATVDGSVKHIGTLLLSNYLFGFEAISVLLLVAVVGAVVLGLKRLT